MAQEPPAHRCFEVWAVIKPIVETKELWAGAAGAILGPLITYIFTRNKKEEMKHLAEALQRSLGTNAEMMKGLLETVDRMADSLRPAARQALRPIGDSCSGIRVTTGTQTDVFDEDTKAQFAGASSTIGKALKYEGILTEMDMDASSCKVHLKGESGRVTAKITDPVAAQPNSIYAQAFAAGIPLEMIAKAEFDSEGNIVRLHVSDAWLAGRRPT